MRLATTAARLTVDEYLALDGPPHTQLIDGVVVVNQPSRRHQLVMARCWRALDDWCGGGPGRGQAYPPIDVRVSDVDNFAPDVCWIAAEHLPPGDDRLAGVPDLVVEVRSPSTWRFDVGIKLQRYEKAGLRELWLVDPIGGTILRFGRSTPAAGEFDVMEELAADDGLTTSLLPGFSARVGDLLV